MKTVVVRFAAVVHAVVVLLVLMALRHVPDASEVQAVAAYAWLFMAVLLAAGVFTSDEGVEGSARDGEK